MRRCCSSKKNEEKESSWSEQEDRKLTDYINVHGEGRWGKVPKSAGLHRCGKCCRLRWMNHLRTSIKQGNYFGEDEEDLIIRLYALLGNRLVSRAYFRPISSSSNFPLGVVFFVLNLSMFPQLYREKYSAMC
ncbi:transcription factor MYB1-like [Primulina tabacum]|uniref:transcription factor MYB1-like n=1 Tax=Primulina tabacum TaxID=48773 RepID=UPI003F5A5334